MRSIKNKLGYSCIIGTSAIALSLFLINNLFSSESDSTKCIIEKGGKVVYNVESSKSDCSNSIFELFDQNDIPNRLIEGSVDTKILGLDEIKENASSGGGSGTTASGDTIDLGNEIIPSEDLREDTDTQCGVPVWKDQTIDGDTYKVLTIGSDTYANIKSLNNIPTGLSNVDTTFTATCASRYTTEVDGKSSNTITFTCVKKDNDNKPTWVSNASQCYKLATLSKCWSASGGRTVSKLNSIVQKNDIDATIKSSYTGFVDLECCNSYKGLYVSLDLKLKRALCEDTNESIKYGCERDETNNTYSIDEKIYDENWKTRPKEEKLIKYASLSGGKVDLKCLNLSGLNMQKEVPDDIDEGIKNLTDVKSEKDTNDKSLYIHKFNAAIESKDIAFSYRPRPINENSNFSDGCNLKKANFSGSRFSGTYTYFGHNEYSSGNAGSNLSDVNFSNSQFNSSVEFGINYKSSSGNPGSNLTNANFSNTSFNARVYFGYNEKSNGNPYSNLTNANFKNTKFTSYVYFARNEDSSSGNPNSNLTGADFSGSNFNNSVNFASNDNSTGNPYSNLTNANFSKVAFNSNMFFGFNRNSSLGNPISNLTNANFADTTFTNATYFGYNDTSIGNPGSNLMNADFSGATFYSVYFANNVAYSTGNPGSNLTNANFSNSNIKNMVHFNNGTDSTGNPSSNLTNAIFEGSSLNGTVKAERTNTCKVKSFDGSGRLSKTCPAEVDGDVNNDVYNPYCALNSNDENCCAEYNLDGTCKVKGWNGTH